MLRILILTAALSSCSLLEDDKPPPEAPQEPPVVVIEEPIVAPEPEPEPIPELPPVPAQYIVHLRWMPPTENTDGSILTDLSNYIIYYGVGDSLAYSRIVSNGLTEAVLDDISVVEQPPYSFVIVAINSSGVASEHSNKVIK